MKTTSMTRMLITASLLASLLNSLHAAPLFTFADTPSRFSYTYIEAIVATDNTDNHGNTYGVGGSFNIIPNVNLLANYTKTDIENGSKDLNLFSIGLGYHFPVGLNTDIVANIFYLDEDEAVTSGNVTTTINDSGASAGVGVRHLFTRFLEGNINLNFTHVHDSNAKTTLGMRYHYSNQLSGEINYTVDDDDYIGASIRLSF